jgi:two-component system, NtrC family, response regulator AtoC
VSSFLLVLTVVQKSDTRSLVKTVLEGAGHRVIESDGYRQAQLLLGNGLSPDLLLIARSPLGAIEAAQCEQLLKSISPERICLIAGMGEDKLRDQALQSGVRHVLSNPVTRGDLESTVEKFNDPTYGLASTGGTLGSSSATPRSQSSVQMPALPYIEELGADNFFLAASPKMLEIHRQVKLLAEADVNVLILGESGTGKEVIAQLVHRNSQRAHAKFLKVNCAALPTDLLESELFGHRQGAFTGAIKDQPGKFEQANGGTLLLDEIGEIGVQIQAKLLHVLQDGQFTRLGGQTCTKVNVRVLAATNIQMENALANKTFREDLYYRLSVFTIQVPPLRERCEEIPYFIEETIRRAPTAMKRGGGNIFTSRLLDASLLYDWPGNLRELRNFVIRTIIMRDPEAAVRELESKIEAGRGANLPKQFNYKPLHGSGMRSVVRDLKDRTEMQMIQDALELSRWNRRQAAQALNISYRALLYKIQQHGLTPRTAGDFGHTTEIDYSIQTHTR